MKFVFGKDRKHCDNYEHVGSFLLGTNEVSKTINSVKKTGLSNLEKNTEERQIKTDLCSAHYHKILHFDTLKIYSCENNRKKGEITCNKQFPFFSQCFSPYMALIFHFKCILKCRLQFVSIWTSLKSCLLVLG